jgi:hypothetical protein
MPRHGPPGDPHGLQQGNGFDIRQLASAILAPIVGAAAGGAGGLYGSALQFPSYLQQGGATGATGAQNRRGRAQGVENFFGFFPYAANNIVQGANRGYQDLTAEVTNPNYDADAMIQRAFQMFFGGGR